MCARIETRKKRGKRYALRRVQQNQSMYINQRIIPYSRHPGRRIGHLPRLPHPPLVGGFCLPLPKYNGAPTPTPAPFTSFTLPPWSRHLRLNAPLASIFPFPLYLQHPPPICRCTRLLDPLAPVLALQPLSRLSRLHPNRPINPVFKPIHARFSFPPILIPTAGHLLRLKAPRPRWTFSHLFHKKLAHKPQSPASQFLHIYFPS